MSLKIDVELLEFISIFIMACLVFYLVYIIIRYTYLSSKRRSEGRRDRLGVAIDISGVNDLPPSYDCAINQPRSPAWCLSLPVAALK